MHKYRRAWFVWWSVLALVGTAVALVLWPGPAMAATWILGAAVGAFFKIGVSSAAEEVIPFAALDFRDLVRTAAFGALVVSGAAGWGKVSAGGTAALVILAVLTCPPMVRQALRLVGRQPDPLAHLDADTDLASSLEAACRDFSTVELCEAWQQTFVADRTLSPPQVIRLLVVRQAFLDELARRNPAGLDAWMASLTPVHTAPTAFFATGPDPQAA
jgi:hypothetical protein